MEEEMVDDAEVPSFILPLFFTSKTQEIFECKVDENVTEESPHKLIPKDKILQDYKDRAAISDFYPAKEIVVNYPVDELLVVYDPVFQYGQNFYLVTEEDEKDKILNPPEEEEEEAVIEDIIEVRYGLRTPKPWVSQGSEAEVMDEMIAETKEKISFLISRKRESFGCPIEFEDRFEPDDLKDIAIDCISYSNDDESIMTKELDKGIQHVAEKSESSAQTDWLCPRNANTQYTPRSNNTDTNEEIMASDPVLEFLAEVIPRFEFAMEQNATMDVFTNDYAELGEEDSMFGSKLDNHLKEYQSFTDLQFSKNKTISAIQWHPTIKGLIAVSCMEHMSFYERVDASSHCLMAPSLILVWSFADPIHPLLLLESPDDVLCFQFNPSDPNIISAGCLNGQIVLWHLHKYEELLLNHRTQGQSSQNNQNVANLPVFMQPTSLELSPMLRYSAVSSIDHSHRSAIMDIQWIPDHIEIGRMGVVLENKTQMCSQIMTCASDGHVLFWDTRASKAPTTTTTATGSNHNNSKKHSMIERQPSIFQHLDLVWKPVLKVGVHRLRGSGEYSPVKFSISEVQSKEPRPDPILEEDEQVEDNGMNFKRKDEGKVLENISTKFFVATEDGEIVYLDWKPTKDIDTGKIVSSNPDFCLEAHDSQIKSLQKSPFLDGTFLTVGGYTFSIWKEGITGKGTSQDVDVKNQAGPLFQSYSHDCKLSDGYWSPSRPAVFFIGKQDGSVDVWDLLDKTHEPFLTQNVTPVPIKAVYPHQISKNQQLLAAGDEIGTLHIMEIPWNLKQPISNELTFMKSYLERETQRLLFHQEHQANYASNTTASVDTIEPPNKEQQIELDEEWEEKAKVEFETYLELERKVLEDLGISKDEE